MRKLFFLFFGLSFCFGNAQVINFPDANFKAKLLASSSSTLIASNITTNIFFKIDANSDNEIQVSEALQVGTLDVSASNIVSLTGIEYFTNLHFLNCETNQLAAINVNGLTSLTRLDCNGNQIASLNVSALTAMQQLACGQNQIPALNIGNLTNLTFLDCRNNQLTDLNLTGLIHIGELWCGGNQLTQLDVGALADLRTLYCDYNLLTTLDVSNLTANLVELNCNNNLMPSIDVSALTNLQELSCRNNIMPSLNVNGLTSLQRLDCYNNHLTTLDVSGLNSLGFLNCGKNQLTTVNVNSLLNLTQLNCTNNLLTSLFIKNGINENYLIFSNNPNLEYICADEGQITSVQNLITTYGYTNCYVNSYCSFSPGGTFFSIQGNSRYDFDNNGCDAADLNYPNLKLLFVSGTSSGSLIPDASGHYQYDVQSGTHVVTPQMENPSYFSISPTTATINFPAMASPIIKNFCIHATGVHPDLGVIILPTTIARPNFDATYKILIHNKGTQAQSGSIHLSYDDAVLDFVSSNPSILSQSAGLLVFDFDALQPFASKEIFVTFNVNSPTETPAVNSGDILHYTAAIITATDETPVDNVFELNQTVVNALDPNDKTCLEGTTITPEMVGKEVHYMIRFENTGTANAENIVVKDMIDTTKFDINSLIPIDGSAPFTTRINGNKVEFIFENINLPFDDAHNDGYVAFKIKTKPSLVLGNTFSNTASIYFDYNFPIVTNTATTTVALLAVHDFAFEDYFRIYPNPAKSILNISVKQSIDISSISIYNVLGQLVLVIPNAQQIAAIDVSNLKTGNYFIKIISDKGSSNAKFIKE